MKIYIEDSDMPKLDKGNYRIELKCSTTNNAWRCSQIELLALSEAEIVKGLRGHIVYSDREIVRIHKQLEIMQLALKFGFPIEEERNDALLRAQKEIESKYNENI